MSFFIRDNFIFFFLLFFHPFTFCLEAKEPMFHVILATDLEADDIEDGVERDLERIQKEIGIIAKYTHMEVSEKLFLGKKSDPQKLLTHLHGLNVESDDVIFFYFSGHGYRTKLEQENDWPSLAFEKADVGIRFTEISEVLQTKPARLTLLFADCCNNKMSLSSAPKILKPKAKLQRKEINSLMKAGYQKLFLEAHGLLMVASAQAGEYSYTDDDDGSMYTIALTKGFKEISQLPVENVTWEALIDVSQSRLLKMTKKNKVKQHPVIFNAILEN